MLTHYKAIVTGRDALSASSKRDDDGNADHTSRSLGQAFADSREDLIRFMSRRTSSPATAADLCHDMFLKLDGVQAEISTLEKARSYLFRMARNLTIDHQRGEKRRSEILEGAQVLFEDVELSPEEIAISRDQLAQVERALAELPPKVAEVLKLSRVHGLSHREIASTLNISVSLVEKYQLRALTHCRKRLAAAGRP